MMDTANTVLCPSLPTCLTRMNASRMPMADPAMSSIL